MVVGGGGGGGVLHSGVGFYLVRNGRERESKKTYL